MTDLITGMQNILCRWVPRNLVALSTMREVTRDTTQFDIASARFQVLILQGSDHCGFNLIFICWVHNYQEIQQCDVPIKFDNSTFAILRTFMMDLVTVMQNILCRWVPHNLVALSTMREVTSDTTQFDIAFARLKVLILQGSDHCGSNLIFICWVHNYQEIQQCDVPIKLDNSIFAILCTFMTDLVTVMQNILCRWVPRNLVALSTMREVTRESRCHENSWVGKKITPVRYIFCCITCLACPLNLSIVHLLGNGFNRGVFCKEPTQKRLSHSRFPGN